MAGLVAFLDEAGLRDNTLILVMCDNGASQEGGPLGMVNAMGPYNGMPEPIAEKIARMDDIGGPDTHANFPRGWAMAVEHPLQALQAEHPRRRHPRSAGGLLAEGIAARGEIRARFRHACDIVPTLLEVDGR